MTTNYKDKVYRLNCLAHDLDAVYHQAALKLGISDSVLCILYVIYEKGDSCLLQDICNESSISKQTINSALRKLEKDEILYLEQDKGRAKRVCLTDKGKVYLDQTAAKLYEAENNVFEDWTEDEYDSYVRLMRKYIDSLRVQIDKMGEKGL